MLAMTQLVGFGVGDVPAVVTYATNAVDTTDLTTYTFSSQSLSSAAGGRYVVVGVVIGFATARTISTVTIGGVSASLIGSAVTSANLSTAFYGALVETGATGNVVVTASGACICAGIGIWALYNLASQTPVDTGTSTADPGSDSLTTSTGGVALAFACNANTLATYTWSGVTENFDATVEAGSAVSYSGGSANITTGSNLSISATRTGGITQPAMVTASFR